MAGTPMYLAVGWGVSLACLAAGLLIGEYYYRDVPNATVSEEVTG